MDTLLHMQRELESERLAGLVAAVSSAQAQGTQPPAALTQQDPTDPASPVDVSQAGDRPHPLVQPSLKESESDPQAWAEYLADVRRAFGPNELLAPADRISRPVLDHQPVSDAKTSVAGGLGMHCADQQSGQQQQQQDVGSSQQSSERSKEQQSQQHDDQQQQQAVGIGPAEQQHVFDAEKAAAAWCEKRDLQPFDLISQLPGLEFLQPNREDMPAGVYESAAGKVVVAAMFSEQFLSFGVGATADEAAADASVKALARLLQATQHEQHLRLKWLVQKTVGEITETKLWQQALAARPGFAGTASSSAAADATQEDQQQQQQQDELMQPKILQQFAGFVMGAVSTAARSTLDGWTALQALGQDRSIRIEKPPATSMSPAATAKAEAEIGSVAMAVHDGRQLWACAVAPPKKAPGAAADEGFRSLLLANCLYGLLLSASSAESD